ncbi:MAG: hypothetical protein H6828_00795 [Planctomycetes bacterium]|nr:hypothetical protein [Planctomycetota bacterium]
MSRRPLRLLALPALLLTGLAVLRAQAAAPTSPFLTGVRVESVDLAGNGWHLETTCHLTNRSLSTPIVLGDLQVLGPGGRTDVLATSSAFNGRSLPALAELRVAVDGTLFPGLAPQTSEAAPGARTLVVAWTGAPEALELTGVLKRYPPSDVDQQVHVQTRGFAVLP